MVDTDKRSVGSPRKNIRVPGSLASLSGKRRYAKAKGSCTGAYIRPERRRRIAGSRADKGTG